MMNLSEIIILLEIVFRIFATFIVSSCDQVYDEECSDLYIYAHKSLKCEACPTCQVPMNAR